MNIVKPDKTIYEPNADVKITVVNKPKVDKSANDTIYAATVTLKVSRDYITPLRFSNNEDIADFMGTVDYDDPQQLLDLGDSDE